ncbi:hypothetical protein BMG03_19520 (plasmid) [Thioclava nitratireducens]|uniref:Uncharacterized protein n=1 Tax=Thioclava nitratireducens TaxID=1915078 RepID=A0ABM6IMC0_9RHOB|nr:hypothetical protein [Thioclava nitratireducens]AQS50105.1 hypothetical protein BMG03_19520 [Thioclava nitratireducens]
MIYGSKMTVAGILAITALGVGVPLAASAAEVGSSVGVNAGAQISSDAGSSAALATGANAAGQAEAQTPEAGTVLDAAKVATQSSAMTVGSLVSTLETQAKANAMGDVSAKLADSDAAAQVKLVTLTDLETGSRALTSRVESAIDSQKSTIGKVQKSISENAKLSAALSAKGYVASDVIGVAQTAGGDIIIVIDNAG